MGGRTMAHRSNVPGGSTRGRFTPAAVAGVSLALVTTGMVCATSASADSQAPAAPRGVTARVVANAVVLDWADNAEADLSYYAVRRTTNRSLDMSRWTR